MRSALIAAAMLLAAPAWAQHAGHDMSGHTGHAMPMEMGPPAPSTPIDPDCPPEHAAMGHCTPKPVAPPQQDDHGSGGTALPAGNAPAPAAVDATYADRIWGADAMAASRAHVVHEHGGGSFSQIMLNIAEVQARRGRNGYRWDGEAWFGGDIDRLVVKSEGEAAFSRSPEHAEVQALYSRALGPYFNLQAGLRQDLGSGPNRTHAALGFEGLAPYWFEVEGLLYLSTKGDLTASLEAYYDQRITQRLILQPRAELHLSAQRVPESGLGSGLTDAELGLRLRYEIFREFAPYVGVSWDRRFGGTARLARAAGDRRSSTNVVLGIRAWF